MTERDTRLDVARGLAIAAIVVGHVGRGLVDAGVLDQIAHAPWDRALYMSHLAVFVFVAGVLTPGGVRRHGERAYAMARVRLFLYLYVVWSVLQGSVRVVLAEATNSHMDWTDVLQLWIPRGQMWFLPFIAAATLLVVLLQPWRPGRRWIAIVAVAASLLVWGSEAAWVFTQGWPLVGALFVGALLGPKAVAWLEVTRRPVVVCLLTASTLAVFVLLLGTAASPPTYQLPDWSFAGAGLGLVASATGVAFVLAVSAALATTWFGAALAVLGRNSMAIFLAHILAASGTRVLLELIGVGNVVVHLASGIAAGIVLPLLLVAVARKPVLSWIFDDRPLTGRIPPRAVNASEGRG